MITCPQTNQLSDLILGVLPAESSQSLTEHVGECTKCQELIQTIASGEFPVDRLITAAAAAKPPTESGYWEVVKQVESDLGQTRTWQLENSQGTGVDGDALPLDQELAFLSPTDDPVYLGRLQHFEIARVIGRGGMGVVFEAFDTHLHRRVAIKVLSPKFQHDTTARQRFCREGRTAASISHEHVVPLYQVAKLDEGEIAFLVMQLIEGETLEQRLQHTAPFPTQEVARIAMQIAAGLSAAHASGLVHRDIKPANVLIEKETDRVKLTDFGLARAADEMKLTQTGMVTGTVLYMSPEQATGTTPDERSDLFSLGAVMYEMATGTPPFNSPTAIGLMKQIMDETPVSPNKINSNISNPLSNLIMNLINKSPDDRPDSASEVAQVLAAIVTEYGPISPLQVPAIASSQVKKLSRKHSAFSRMPPLAQWSLVGAGLALLGLSFYWLATAPTDFSKRLSTEHAQNPSVELADGNKNLIDATAQFPSVALPDNPGTVWSVDFAHDGKTIAAAVADGSVRIWNIDTQELVKKFNAHRGIVWTARFHPTLDLFATTGDDSTVKLWDSKSFELIREWQADNSVRGLAFSPNEKSLVTGDRNGNIRVYDLKSGETLATHTQPGSILGLDYSPDGKFVATVGSDKTVRLFDTSTFEERQTFTGHDGPIYNVVFDSTGTRLASVGWNKNIRVWNVETGEETMKLEGSEGDIWGVAFCGQGNHLITGGQDGTARLWNLVTGVNTTTLRGHDAAVHNISLDPVKHRIATSSRDGSIRVWDMSALDANDK